MFIEETPILTVESEQLEIIQQDFIPHCMSGNIKQIKTILKDKRIEINEHDMYGRRSLVEASYAGQINVVRFLVQIPGTDINIKDVLNKTPLSASLKKNYMDIAKFLLSLNYIQLDEQSAKMISYMLRKGFKFCVFCAILLFYI